MRGFSRSLESGEAVASVVASVDAKRNSSRARRRWRGRKKQINVTPKDADGAEITRDEMKKPLVVVEEFPFLVVSEGAAAEEESSWEINVTPEDADGVEITLHEMENACADPVRCFSSSQESGEAVAFVDAKGKSSGAAADANGKSLAAAYGRKNQSLDLHRLQIGSPERTLDWDEEQIEGLDWDEVDLKEYINSYIKRYHGLADNDDEEFWAYYDQQQLTELKIRLALHRIRAHEWPKLKGLSNAELKEKYPLNMLEENGYFRWFECDFEWYFDPEYCEYANLQDYQRLTLRDNGEYKDWKYYNETRSTLESDQKFVQFWEKLASKTKWIPNVLETKSLEWYRISQMAFYHSVKIAAEFPDIYTRLLYCGFTEYLWSIEFDNSWYKDFACLYFEIWKLVAKQKMNFKDALDHLKDKGMRSLCSFEMEAELESDQLSPGPITYHYKTYVAHIDANHTEAEAYQLTMEAVKKFVPKKKIYYDYAKKKLDIAAKIGLIP